MNLAGNAEAPVAQDKPEGTGKGRRGGKGREARTGALNVEKDTPAQAEIRAAIQFYDGIGRDWTNAVVFIGIRHLFGGWGELCDNLRSPYGLRRKQQSG